LKERTEQRAKIEGLESQRTAKAQVDRPDQGGAGRRGATLRQEPDADHGSPPAARGKRLEGERGQLVAGVAGARQDHETELQIIQLDRDLAPRS
jgi:hypothetical protein